MRVRTALRDPPFEAFVDHDMHRAGAMCTRRRDLDLQAFVSEAPLHEGRSEGILRSSTENALSSTESQAMWSRIAGNRESPAHIAAGVADQEE